MILNNFYQYLVGRYVAPEDYVLFSGPSSFTIAPNNLQKDGDIYYSTDGVKYKIWGSSATITAALDSSDNLYKIYLQGKGNTYVKTALYSRALTMTGSNVTLSGSLMALLDAEVASYGAGSIPDYSTETFRFLFNGCSALVSAKNLKILPILTSNKVAVYYGMFLGCANLEDAPFMNCAGTAGSFYSSTFEGTKLKEPPIIMPNETSGGDFRYMFKGKFLDNQLVKGAPIALKPLSWALLQFNEMYAGQPALVRMPRIREFNKSVDCSSMFKGCSSLKISDTQDATYQYAFTLPATGTFTDMFANTGGTFTGTPTAGTTYYTDHPLVEPYYPIHFSSANSFTIAQSTGSVTWNGTIEYSTDEYNWTTWDGTTITAVSDGSTYHLFFRGTGNTKIGDNASTNYWTVTGSNVSVSGEMDALMDYSNTIARTGVTIADGAYAGWLRGQTAIIDASTLIINTVNTSNSCASMFLNCTSLTGAPFLAATSLAYRCYIDMFHGCTSLVEGPMLPATTLEGDCYYAMFAGCTGLTKPSALPSTSTKNNCYREMFKGCSSLVKAPKLPATSMDGSYFYYQMFMDCTSLVKAPALPSTSFGFSWNDSQYREMFRGCTALKEAPALPITNINHSSCYYGMFNGCTSLVKAPELPSTTLKSECYREMFKGCTSLTVAPELPAETLAGNCYREMFNGCTSLVKAPTELPATTGQSECYNSMFANCTSLVQSPKIKIVDAGYANFSGTFNGCTNLEIIPDLSNVTASNPNFLWYETFKNCSKVKVYTDSSMGNAFLVGQGSAYGSTFSGTGGDYKGEAQDGVTYYTTNTLI